MSVVFIINPETCCGVEDSWLVNSDSAEISPASDTFADRRKHLEARSQLLGLYSFNRPTDTP
jgi:hypothetical protein